MGTQHCEQKIKMSNRLETQNSAAQFIVFREKRKMARREISREKLLTKKSSSKISKK